MIRASGLYGRSVVDLDTAERVGDVDEIIVDPNEPGIAGYVVSCERAWFGTRRRIIVPVEAIHAIGPDALTMRSIGRSDTPAAYLDALPRLSELTGRRMVSFGGRLLGAVEDALIDERDGRIVGYPLERRGPSSWIEALFGLGWRSERPDYVRADAALRIGARLIVVPDDAIASAGDPDDASPVALPALTPETPPAAAEPSPSAIRQSQAMTTPFSMNDILAPDADADLPYKARVEGERAASALPSADHAPAHDVDPEEDTGLIAASGTDRSRPRRRPQAERVR